MSEVGAEEQTNVMNAPLTHGTPKNRVVARRVRTIKGMGDRKLKALGLSENGENKDPRQSPKMPDASFGISLRFVREIRPHLDPNLAGLNQAFVPRCRPCPNSGMRPLNGRFCPDYGGSGIISPPRCRKTPKNTLYGSSMAC